MNNQLKVITAPVIDYKDAVELLGQEIDNQLKELDLDNVVATEENKKNLKDVRSELNKKFKLYETERKKIKAAINDPYKEFEDTYKEKVASKFKDVDLILKTKIEEVEQSQKDEKEQEIFNYFLEVTEDKPELEFITFKSLDLNITLSASLKSYKDKIDAVIEQVEKELQVIESNPEKARLLVKYKKTRDLSGSINELNFELSQEAVVKNVDLFSEPEVEVVSENEKPNNQTLADDSNDVIEEISFTLVGATKGQIRNIRTFIESLGVKYE